MPFGIPIPELPSSPPISGFSDLLSKSLPGTNVHTPKFGDLPWSKLNSNSPTNINSAFFTSINPDGTLWDKLLPYRLIVWDTTTNGVVGYNDFPTDVSIYPLGNGTLAFEPMDSSWEFRLPITPQQLNITDTYAINTSATLRGVLEEHSGVRFKNISIQGTFGIWPGRPSIVNPPSTPGALASVFGGTLSAASNVSSQFQSIANAASTGSFAAKPLTVSPGDSKDHENGQGTGYYQTIMLQQFLEQYAEAKKNPVNAGWRLVFDIPKQNQAFVVTPLAFTWSENVNKPLEINYNLQLKAWRRIDIHTRKRDKALTVTSLTPGALQKILNTISAARNAAAASYNLIGAVRSDVDNVLNIIRQTSLMVKDFAGVFIAMCDLPTSLTQDYKSTISDFLATMDPDNMLPTTKGNKTTLSQIQSIKIQHKRNEGLSLSAIDSGQLGANAKSTQSINPAYNAFKEPQKNPQLFESVPVNSLKLNNAQKAAYVKELSRVRAFTVSDLKAMRGVISDLSSQLATSFNATSAFYSKMYNKPSTTTRTEPMNLDEFDLLQNFYALMQSYDVLTATNQLDANKSLDNMEFVQGLANNSGIQFKTANSKIQVPVPFGLNMEQIALRYLGDHQRWLEIVTLNQLAEPYIDEVGFTYALTSNGDGRNVVISSKENLYVGQKISINSNVQGSTTRTILDITMLSQTSFLLTLDGNATMDIYKLIDGAFIKAYLPNTTNSQKVIFVPSDQSIPSSDGISIPESVANIDLVALSKVDWLLDDTDLAINSDGDVRLAAGIPNLIQALTIKLSTSLKSSVLHPEFGLPISIGQSNSDVTAGKIYNNITKLITADTRFAGISGLQVTMNGPSISISLGVQIAGLSGIFPINFQLGNS